MRWNDTRVCFPKGALSMQNKFPQRLRQLRKEKGITQEALGQYLHYNHTAVANYESGRNPTLL